MRENNRVIYWDGEYKVNHSELDSRFYLYEFKDGEWELIDHKHAQTFAREWISEHQMNHPVEEGVV